MEPAAQPNSSISRARVIVLFVAVAVMLGSIVLVMRSSPAGEGRAPRLLSLQLAPTNASPWEMYNWDGVDPCRDGKVWIWVRSGSNPQEYLYDLNKKLVVGKMTNAGASFFNGDSTKLVCEQASDYSTFAQRMAARFNVVLAKLLSRPIPKPAFRYEGVWLLNMQSNSATRVGTLKEFNGSGSDWRPSPSHQYAFRQSSAQSVEKVFSVFDFNTEQLKELPCKMWPCGWWDDQTVLLTDYSEVALYNIVTGQTTNVFTRASIDAFIKTNELTLHKRPAVFFEWNGRQYDFYFAPEDRYGTNKAFLATISRSGPSLELISRDFKFEWLGHFSPDKRLYLFSGEKGRWGSGGNGSVMVRDLRDNSTRALVPPDKSGQYALCRFFEGGVIYSRNRQLWRIDLNGSNNAPLFSGNGN